MSYTEITTFDNDGNVGTSFEVENAWRGAMSIWQHLEKKYLPEYIPEWAIENIEHFRENFKDGFSRTIDGKLEPMKEIWSLYDSDKVNINDKIILFSTFDKSIVIKRDFDKLIEAFLLDEYKNTSLSEQAEIIKEIQKNKNISAIAWCQTSVIQNRWTCFEYDENNDLCIPYNYKIQDDHYILDTKCMGFSK